MSQSVSLSFLKLNLKWWNGQFSSINKPIYQQIRLKRAGKAHKGRNFQNINDLKIADYFSIDH